MKDVVINQELLTDKILKNLFIDEFSKLRGYNKNYMSTDFEDVKSKLDVHCKVLCKILKNFQKLSNMSRG